MDYLNHDNGPLNVLMTRKIAFNTLIEFFVLFFSIKQAGTSMLLMMMMQYGHELTMPFQLVDMEEVPIVAPREENIECVLEGIQALLAIHTTYMTKMPLMSNRPRWDKLVILRGDTKLHHWRYRTG